MTVAECRALDAKMKRYTRIGRFIRKHINKALGEWIEDKVYDRWDKAYA